MPQERKTMGSKELGVAIKNHLLAQGHKPGERIETEHELADRFGVSRYKIRFVLNSLVQQGILVKTPRRGTFIREIDQQTLSDNLNFTYRISRLSLHEQLEARIVVELAILPLVVRRATPSQIAAMEETIDRMVRNKDVPQQADREDFEFHMLLLRACGNDLLASFSTLLSNLFRDSEYRQKYWKPEIITRLAAEHRLILDAIQQGDVDLAIERHKSHLHYREKVEGDPAT